MKIGSWIGSWIFVIGALLFGSILVPLYIRIKKLRPLKEVLEEYRSSKQKEAEMNNTVIRRVSVLQGIAKAMAEKQGLDPDDLVVLTVSIEKVVGDPVSFLLSEVQSSVQGKEAEG